MTVERPKHSAKVEDMLQKGKALTNWIAANQHALEIPGDSASLIPSLQFDQCIEHHVGIVGLVDAHVYGSAFALLRASTESLVRGVWLRNCATEDQRNAYTDNDKLPRGLTFHDMVNACTAVVGFGEGCWLTSLAASWSAMNSYTHSGTLQLGRRLQGKEIFPNYEPEEIIEVLKTSATSALVAIKQIAKIAAKDALVAEVSRRLEYGQPKDGQNNV